MANKKITDLTAATTLNDDDLFPCVSGVGVSPVTEKISVANLRTVVGTGNTIISSTSGDYNVNPAAATSDNQIAFSNTTNSGIQAGDICSFVQNSITNYYLVKEVSSGNYVEFAGPAISIAHNIGDITIYSKSRSVTTDIVFSGAYAINGATTTLINSETKSKFRWNGAKAYLLFVAARNNQADGSGTPAEINVTVARSGSLSTYNDITNYATGGLALTGTGWNTTLNQIDSGQYAINFGDEIEIDLVNSGGDGDARDLTVSLVFGLEF